MKRRSSGTSTWSGNLAVRRLEAVGQLVFEHVRHGDEFDRRAADRQGVGRRAGAAAAAADERHFGRVILRRVDEGNLNAGQCGDGGGGLEKLTTGGSDAEGVFHKGGAGTVRAGSGFVNPRRREMSVGAAEIGHCRRGEIRQNMRYAFPPLYDLRFGPAYFRGFRRGKTDKSAEPVAR